MKQKARQSVAQTQGMPDPGTFPSPGTVKHLLGLSGLQFSWPKSGMMIYTLERIPLCLSEAGIPAATFWYISEPDGK